MTDKLDDLEKQFLKRNDRIIREVGYGRAANNAMDAVEAFEKEFNATWGDDNVGKPFFFDIFVNLAVLKKANPWVPKVKKGGKP